MGPRSPSVSITSNGSIRLISRTRGTSTRTYSSVAPLSMMPKPMPPSCSRAATFRSAWEGDRYPLGWLWSIISPRQAMPGSARTMSTVPLATTRAAVMTPSRSTSAAKETSRPPAAAISPAR